MNTDDLDAAAKAQLAILRAKFPQHFSDSEAQIFELGFAAGANWATGNFIEKLKESA